MLKIQTKKYIHIFNLSQYYKICKQIGSIKKDIEDQKSVFLTGDESVMKKKDQFLDVRTSFHSQEHIEKLKSAIAESKKKSENAAKALNAFKIGIRNIYDSIGCSSEKTEGIHMITESNMLKYLGSIEERTNEILQMYDLCKNKVYILLSYHYRMLISRLVTLRKPRNPTLQKYQIVSLKLLSFS